MGAERLSSCCLYASLLHGVGPISYQTVTVLHGLLLTETCSAQCGAVGRACHRAGVARSVGRGTRIECRVGRGAFAAIGDQAVAAWRCQRTLFRQICRAKGGTALRTRRRSCPRWRRRSRNRCVRRWTAGRRGHFRYGEHFRGHENNSVRHESGVHCEPGVQGVRLRSGLDRW